MISYSVVSYPILTLTSLEISSESIHLTTTDRMLATIDDRPEGITIKELAEILNRPISMVQICLKISIANRKVTTTYSKRGEKSVKVYSSNLGEIKTQPELPRSNPDRGQITPIQLRELVGLTQLQLAIGLGLSIKTINKWEQKSARPKLLPSQLKQMLCVYQCTIDDLIAAFE
jgi:DNA-binding transcriptional regulator YiaG